MENASKALIIAGAILLSILLISLGIMIFGQAQDTISGAGITKAEITAFNSQFTKYEGDKKGSEVKSLISEVAASNAADKADGNGRGIVLKLDKNRSGTAVNGTKASDTGIVTGNPSTGDIISTATYTVTVTATDNSGYVDTITIKKK